MLSSLKEIIPGASHWPSFVKNSSNQFEARVCMVEVQESPCIFLSGMTGSQLPVAVAHGEGQAIFGKEEDLEPLMDQTNSTMAIRFKDNYGSPAGRYREILLLSFGEAMSLLSTIGHHIAELDDKVLNWRFMVKR